MGTPATALEETRPHNAAMDAAFIEEHEIIEKYLAGRLPLRGQLDFERFCLEHPELLDELKLAERLNRGMRLLEAGGRTEVLDPKEKPWQKTNVLIGAAAFVFVLFIALVVAVSKYAGERATITDLKQQLIAGPLKPPDQLRTVLVRPDRVPSERAQVSVFGGTHPELVEVKVDVSFALQSAFRVTVDKKDQARVGTIERMLRDSNGQLKFTFNTSGVTPGLYRFHIEGITLRGETIPVAWMNIRVN